MRAESCVRLYSFLATLNSIVLRSTYYHLYHITPTIIQGTGAIRRKPLGIGFMPQVETRLIVLKFVVVSAPLRYPIL